jgi:hypothetical protein
LDQAVFSQVFNNPQEIVFKEQAVSLLGPLGGPEKAPPGTGFSGFLVRKIQNQYFNVAAAFFATEEPRWNHSGVVDHQEVAGQEEFGKLQKVPVVERPGRTVHHHEARLVPVRERDLSDKVVRQAVIVLFYVEHR